MVQLHIHTVFVSFCCNLIDKVFEIFQVLGIKSDLIFYMVRGLLVKKSTGQNPYNDTLKHYPAYVN